MTICTKDSSNRRQRPLGNLYLIADSNLLNPNSAEDIIRSVIGGGVNMLQFRNKVPLSDSKRRLAQKLKNICNQYGIPFIINDDIDLALEMKADGVHLGVSDTPVKEARSILGKNMIIGASCYNSLDLAHKACDDGADYIAFGAVFSTTTKKNTVSISLDQLRRYTDKISKPVCAIGGITSANVKLVWDCGVDIVAVANGILGCQDPHQETVAIANTLGY